MQAGLKPLTNDQVKATMSPLSQEVLEQLLKEPNAPFLVVIYFTANWCGPCKRVGLQRVTQFRKDIQWYLCDVDANPYSLGYCGGKQIPSWLALVNGKPAGPLLVSADDAATCRWLSMLPVEDVPAKKSSIGKDPL